VSKGLPGLESVTEVFSIVCVDAFTHMLMLVFMCMFMNNQASIARPFWTSPWDYVHNQDRQLNNAACMHRVRLLVARKEGGLDFLDNRGVLNTHTCCQAHMWLSNLHPDACPDQHPFLLSIEPGSACAAALVAQTGMMILQSLSQLRIFWQLLEP